MGEATFVPALQKNSRDLLLKLATLKKKKLATLCSFLCLHPFIQQTSQNTVGWDPEDVSLPEIGWCLKRRLPGTPEGSTTPALVLSFPPQSSPERWKLPSALVTGFLLFSVPSTTAIVLWSGPSSASLSGISVPCTQRTLTDAELNAVGSGTAFLRAMERTKTDY